MMNTTCGTSFSCATLYKGSSCKRAVDFYVAEIRFTSNHYKTRSLCNFLMSLSEVVWSISALKSSTNKRLVLKCLFGGKREVIEK